MYTFMERLEKEVRVKVLDSLKEQDPTGHGYRKDTVDTIVEYKLDTLAKTLVNIFYEKEY